MGQRHQIYAICQHGGVCGVHHGWLFGITACMQAARMMSLMTKLSETKLSYQSPFDSPATGLKMLDRIYSVIPETGYLWEYVDELGKPEIENPLVADNNDGITIFDFSGDKAENFTYCMMFLRRRDRDIVPVLKPLSAKQYVEIYYPPKEQKDEQILAELAEIAANPYKVMSLETVKNAFPAMFYSKVPIS